MKNTYIAIEILEDGKYTAEVLKIRPSDNLLSKLQIKGLVHANICDTKKAALAVADYWNNASFAGGNYPFNRVYPPVVH